MKYILPLLFVLISSFFSFSQEKTAEDQFYDYLSKGSEVKFKSPDTSQLYYDSANRFLDEIRIHLQDQEYTRLNAALLKNEAILASVNNDFTGAMEKLNASLEGYSTITDTFGIASVYSNKGVVSYYTGNFPEALRYFKVSVNLYSQLGDDERYMQELSKVAVIYHYTKKYDSAILYNKMYLIKCLMDTMDPDYEGIADAKNNIAISYNVLGDYDSAMTYFMGALIAYDSLQDDRGRSVILSNIGDVFQNKHEYTKAESYYKQSKNLISGFKDLHSLMGTYLSLCTTKSKLTEYDSAFYFLDQADIINDSLHNTYLMGTSLRKRADIYFDMKDYGKAKGLYLESLKVFESVKTYNHFCNIYKCLAEIELMEKNYQSSVRFIDKSMSYLDENDKAQHMAVYLTAYQVYKEMGYNLKALQAYEQYSTYKDSIQNDKNEKLILELENRYNLAQHEHKIAEQTSQINLLNLERSLISQNNKRNRLIIIGVALGLLVIVILVFMLQRIRGLKKDNMLREAQHNLMQQQMALAKRQLEPHFMLNTLNGIAYMFTHEEKDNAQYYFGKFASLLHRGLIYADKTETSLDEELAFVRDYLELQKRRFSELAYKIDVHETLELNSIMIPHSLVYTFVENALKHGLQHKAGEKQVRITAGYEHEHVVVRIIDNGIGRKEASKRSDLGTGKGLDILRHMVDSYNQLNNRKVSFSILDNTIGTEVVVLI